MHTGCPSKALIASPHESVSSPEFTLTTDPYSLLWEESEYSLDKHYKSHSGSIEIAINAINLIPDIISTSVPTDIYISTNDDSIDSLDPVNSLYSFDT